MIAPLLKSALEPVAARHRRLHLLNWLSLWWLAVAAAGALLFCTHAVSAMRLLLLLCAAAGGAFLLRALARRWQPDFREIARRIEQSHPELHALLVTAVEQQPDTRTGTLHYLQQRVIAEAIRVTRERQWLDAIPRARWAGAVAVQAAALAAMFLVFWQIGMPSWNGSTAKPPAAEAVSSSVAITPGDAAIERGSGLVVLAKFQGEIPGEATLVIQPQNEAPQRLPLVKSLNDPVFGGGLPEVHGDLAYRVEYAGHATRDFTIHVFEHPRLERADATLHYPEYTKLPEKTVPDTRRVSAVEGTKLDVAFQLNKPVRSAVLRTKDGKETALAVEPGKAVATLRGFDIQKSQAYELRLTDAEGRASKLPAQFIVEALPNRRPELKFAMPKGDRRVSPIEEVTFRGEAWDDFGLARYGLTINVAGLGEREVELGRDTRADERREFTHVLKLEDLGVKPDELLSWYLWAEDTGPDGKIRRTATDMYFGEVRPFEEIYRAGDSSLAEQQERQEQQQGGGSGSQAQKLAQNQKQIISATWNLKRAEDGSTAEQKPSEKYRKDEPVVRDAQGDALKQMQTTAGRITDPKSLALVENVTREMQAAHDHLTAAAESPKPLPDALGAEQSAYNALLKLSAHEYEVTRRQRSQQKGQGQGQQANQRQLDELEMKDEKQRYETAKEAAPAQNQQQREQLAVVNRLKELAQRQQDINERLKELQAALQEAKAPQEKEALRDQLKRLREEEQQLLADLDESRQSMDKASQQAQLAEERQKLDRTRAEAQKAAEAMERNAPSQALASGARTARQLQEIRDDVRKKSSGQFNDEMREMRSDARALAENQQAIEEKLQAETAKPERPTLVDGNEPREQIAKDLEKQQTQLTGITEQMKRVSEEAEAVEPLLAKQLYDTLRKTTQAGADEKLKNTKTLAEQGITAEAQKIEKEARGDVEELKAGVERAAESVLGNEAESLKQARDELDALAQQVEREARQARPGLADARQQAGQRGAQPQNAQDRQNGAGDPKKPGNPSDLQARNQDAKENSANGAVPANRQAQAGRNARPERGQPDAASGEAPPSDQPGDQSAQNDAPGKSPNGGKPGQGDARARTAQGGQQSAAPGEASPSDQPGDQSAQNDAPGKSPNGGKPGQGTGSARTAQSGQPGNEKGEGSQAGDAQSEPQTAQNGEPRGRGAARGSQQPGKGEAPGPGRGGSGSEAPADSGGADSDRQMAASAGGGGGGGGGGAFTGEGFVDWSDRLRNVEQMLDSPALRNEAARIRELAKGVRVEFKKHNVQPDWDMVKAKIGQPLVELRNRLAEELAIRDSKESLVPIDRDPVPPKYAERVRSYYEELGRGK